MMPLTKTNLATGKCSKPLCLSGHFSDETSAVLQRCSVSWFKCTWMVPWLGLLLALPEPQRTWPDLVLPGTFPLMKCTFCRSAWPSPVPWPSLNGNFPIFYPSLPASLSASATLVCVTHVLNSPSSAWGFINLLTLVCHCWTGWLTVWATGWLTC